MRRYSAIIMVNNQPVTIILAAQSAGDAKTILEYEYLSGCVVLVVPFDKD